MHLPGMNFMNFAVRSPGPFPESNISHSRRRALCGRRGTETVIGSPDSGDLLRSGESRDIRTGLDTMVSAFT